MPLYADYRPTDIGMSAGSVNENHGEGIADGRLRRASATPKAMDTARILENIYRCYREKRLAEAVALLSDDFQFKTNLPDDPLDPLRPRSRAELTLLAHKFFEEYDILAFEPATITVSDGTASAHLNGVFRHKKTGKVIETSFEHDWRFANGKVCELQQRHDNEGWQAFVKSLDSGS